MTTVTNNTYHLGLDNRDLSLIVMIPRESSYDTKDRRAMIYGADPHHSEVICHNRVRGRHGPGLLLPDFV